jgi:hypothetical protein
VNRDRVVLVAGHLLMLVVGVGLAVWGTFLIPWHWPGDVEGLCVVLGVVGNLVVGWLAAVGLGTPLAGALPGIGWLVTTIVLSSNRAEGDVLIAQGFPADPHLGTVGLLFVFGGAAGALAGVVLGARSLRRAQLTTGSGDFTQADERPTSQA